MRTFINGHGTSEREQRTLTRGVCGNICLSGTCLHRGDDCDRSRFALSNFRESCLACEKYALYIYIKDFIPYFNRSINRRSISLDTGGGNENIELTKFFERNCDSLQRCFRVINWSACSDSNSTRTANFLNDQGRFFMRKSMHYDTCTLACQFICCASANAAGATSDDCNSARLLPCAINFRRHTAPFLEHRYQLKMSFLHIHDHRANHYPPWRL